VSDFGDVPAAILTAIDSAISLGGSSDGFMPYDKIPDDQFPYAMVYNPQKLLERGEFRHSSETTANPTIVVWKNVAMSTVNAAVVLIEAEIASDPTLGGVVEDAWVSLVGRDEADDANFTAAVFQIDTRGSV
jgi:hypothetical protein